MNIYELKGILKTEMVLIHLEEISSLWVPMPSRLIKNRKTREAIILTEIRKRGLKPEDTAFTYQVIDEEKEERKGLRIYLFGKEEIEKVFFSLIQKGFDTERVCPLFSPFILLSEEEPEKDKMLIFLKGKTRFLYVFSGKEFLFQRVYEGEEKELSKSDVTVLNMVYNYCQQTLRIRPQVLVILGQVKDLNELNFPYRIIDYKGPENMFLKLKGKEKELLSFSIKYPKVQKPLKLEKRFKKAAILMLILTFFIGTYGFRTWSSLVKIREDINEKRKNVISMAENFKSITSELQKLEGSPLLNLLKNKIKTVDARLLLNRIGVLRDMESVEFSDILVSPEEGLLKIKGEIKEESFLKRYKVYQSLKEQLISQGFLISSEAWDFQKGTFEIGSIYELKRTL